MRRINVIGSTGSGKTTLAKQFSERLGIPHVELDAYGWERNWTWASNDVFRLRVGEAVKANSWVIDGNYSITRDIVWPRVDTVVWLDYTFGLVLLRLTRRTLRRGFFREKLWNGNVERTWQHFFTKDSLIYYLVRSHWRHRRRFVDLIGDPAYEHVSFVRLHSLQAARNWLATVSLAG